MNIRYPIYEGVYRILTNFHRLHDFPPFLIDMQTFPPETLYKKNSLSKYNPDFFYLCIIEHHNPYPNGGK